MSITAPLLWLDGSMVETQTATVPFMAHAVQRGSAIFDVGSFHATPEGPVLFRAPEHVDRFLRSCAIVGLEVRYARDALVEAARDVVRACGKSDGLVRWSSIFATPESDLFPKTNASRTAVAAQLLEDPPRETPIAIAIFDDARKTAPNALSPAAKVSASYLGPMLHRRRAVELAADEIVLLDHEGNVAETPTGNVFAVIGGALVTPPLDRVLAGITRDSILVLAREEGLTVREAPISRAAFEDAEEIFISSTALPIARVNRVNERTKGPTPIGDRLAAKLHEAQRSRAEWIRPVSVV